MRTRHWLPGLVMLLGSRLIMRLLLLRIGMCLWPRIVLTATCPDLRRTTSPNHRARRLTETLSDLRVIVDTEAWPLGRWLTHHPGHWPLLPQHCSRPRSRRGCLPCDHCPDLITWRWRPHHPSSRPRLASAWTLMRRRQPWSVRSVSRRSHEAGRRSHRPGASHVRRRPETRRWRIEEKLQLSEYR